MIGALGLLGVAVAQMSPSASPELEVPVWVKLMGTIGAFAVLVAVLGAIVQRLRDRSAERAALAGEKLELVGRVELDAGRHVWLLSVAGEEILVTAQGGGPLAVLSAPPSTSADEVDARAKHAVGAEGPGFDRVVGRAAAQRVRPGLRADQLERLRGL